MIRPKHGKNGLEVMGRRAVIGRHSSSLSDLWPVHVDSQILEVLVNLPRFTAQMLNPKTYIASL